MRYPIVLVCCLACINSYANVLQYFAGISYSNPAELFKVKKNEFILGTTGFYADINFNGSVLNLNTFQHDYGQSQSGRGSILPFGRIANRIDDKVVIGVDVTEPFNSNLVWGDHRVTRYASTETLMTDVEVSPRFSYSITPKLYAGAGLNLNFLKNNETNWALPVNQTQYATMINRTAGFGVGYNAGGYYLINQTNFLGLAYFSSVRQDTKGESIFNGMSNTNLTFNFHFPPTTLLNYVHIFNQSWLASLQIFRTQWNANQFARILNTAAQPPLSPDFIFKMNYRASVAVSAALRHQLSERTGLTLIAMQDNGPERGALRTINFPSDTQYFGALAVDYKIAKNTTLEVLCGGVYSKTIFYNQLTLNEQTYPFTNGKVHIYAGVADLKLKIQL